MSDPQTNEPEVEVIPIRGHTDIARFLADRHIQEAIESVGAPIDMFARTGSGLLVEKILENFKALYDHLDKSSSSRVSLDRRALMSLLMDMSQVLRQACTQEVTIRSALETKAYQVSMNVEMQDVMNAVPQNQGMIMDMLARRIREMLFNEIIKNGKFFVRDDPMRRQKIYTFRIYIGTENKTYTA